MRGLDITVAREQIRERIGGKISGESKDGEGGKELQNPLSRNRLHRAKNSQCASPVNSAEAIAAACTTRGHRRIVAQAQYR